MLELRELLLCGEFRPGERLSELPLAAHLGVSRPIRLALERLATKDCWKPCLRAALATCSTGRSSWMDARFRKIPIRPGTETRPAIGKATLW